MHYLNPKKRPGETASNLCHKHILMDTSLANVVFTHIVNKLAGLSI